MESPSLVQLKARWNDVLDDLEQQNRTAWLAVFDGRIAHVDATTLVLDFSDATKLAGVHGFERDRRPEFADALADSVARVTGWRPQVRLVAQG